MSDSTTRKCCAEGENCCESAAACASEDIAELLEETQAKLAQAEAKRDDYLQTAQRVQAEFENYKRRTAGVRAEAYEDGMRQLVSDILPVIDNFDRALSAAESFEQDKAARSLYEGVEMVSKQLIESLMKHGLEVINPIGEMFDPELHNAAMQSPAEEGQTPGSIVDVFQKGYSLSGKMIRYAMVRVAGE